MFTSSVKEHNVTYYWGSDTLPTIHKELADLKLPIVSISSSGRHFAALTGIYTNQLGDIIY